jgi:hypothetical protein
MSDNRKITYRGASMSPDWPEQIRRAQTIPTAYINGAEIPRIRFGAEPDAGATGDGPCGDCGVIKGELHVEGCSRERCPGCGARRFSCDCEPYEDT